MKKTLASTFSFFILFGATVAWTAPVPDTGQTKCYNNTAQITCPSPGQPFYGQDGNNTINPMSYTKLDSSGNALPDSATSWVMVKDNVTGLIWEMKTNMDGVKNYNNPHDADNTYTWYDSNPATNGGNAGTQGNGTDTEDFIKALNDAHFGGYSDWRLPTIKELAYIVNYGSGTPRITTEFFPNTVSSKYWSSTTDAFTPQYAWYMAFDWNDNLQNPKSYEFRVMAVRDGQSESFGILSQESFEDLRSGLTDGDSTATRFLENADGTVTDTSTGLMWQQETLFNNLRTWEEALSDCESLNLGGYTDWRLPTVKELVSLVSFSRYDPAIDITKFPDAYSSKYWTSTTYSNLLSHALTVGFNEGRISSLAQVRQCSDDRAKRSSI